jgi:hypothetical protein
MSVQRVNEQFEWLMRSMVEKHECAQGNIEDEIRRIIRVTVNSCATMYGFSAQEALKRLNSNGEIIEVSEKNPKQQKEEEKAEKLKMKEAEKAEKLKVKAQEDRRKGEKQCASFWKRQQKIEDDKVKEAKKLAKKADKLAKEAEKANEFSERNAMKDEDILSKAAEKLRLKEAKKLAKEAEKLAKKVEKKQKANITFIIESDDEESLASTVLMTDSEDEEPYVLFQNIPLINEINSICDVKNFKNFKKLSTGVKLARQILDI